MNKIKELNDHVNDRDALNLIETLANKIDLSRTFKSHGDYDKHFSLSRDGKYIGVLAFSKSAKIINLETNDCVILDECHSYVMRCSFSHNSEYFLTGTTDGTVKIWNVESGECFRTYTVDSYPLTICSFLPGDKNIIVCSGHVATVVCVQTGKHLKVIKEDDESAKFIIMSPDGKYLLSECNNNSTIWKIKTCSPIATIMKNSTSSGNRIFSCAFSPNSEHFVLSPNDGNAAIRSVRTGKLLHELRGQTSVVSCAFSPNGKYVVTGSTYNTVKVWNVKTGRCLRTFEGHQGVIMSCSFSHNNRCVLTSSSDCKARIWSIKTGRCVRILEGHNDCIPRCSYSRDGKSVITISRDGALRLWDLDQVRLL